MKILKYVGRNVLIYVARNIISSEYREYYSICDTVMDKRKLKIDAL